VELSGNVMLAVLAAVVPILASTYVAGSVLLEHARAAHVARVYPRVWGRYNAELADLKAEMSMHDPRWNARSQALTARRMRLLEANGIDPYVGTMKAMSDSAVPQAPSAIDQRRQWVLLFGSLVGVFFLALSLL
tara:strand:- start:25048 stop:25449 length:402 start_codon:yes stop_codon:yes gene_type:complete